MADVPRPERSVAFCSHVCTSADAYTRSTRPPAPTPASRTFQPARAARAAKKPTRLAMLPPLTRIPPHSDG